MSVPDDLTAETRRRLDAAESALEASATLFISAIYDGSDQQIEDAYTRLRVAKTLFCAARASHRDRCAEAASDEIGEGSPKLVKPGVSGKKNNDGGDGSPQE